MLVKSELMYCDTWLLNLILLQRDCAPEGKVYEPSFYCSMMSPENSRQIPFLHPHNNTFTIVRYAVNSNRLLTGPIAALSS